MSMMFEDRKAYAFALEKAAREVGSLDPAAVVVERGVEFEEAGRAFALPFLGTSLKISFPDGQVYDSMGRRPSSAVAILVLHYLVYRGEPLRSRQWLAYRDMPGGREFHRAFDQMAQRPLAAHFGDRLEAFGRSARALGGEKRSVGDCSYEITAFPRLNLMTVLWPSTEEGEGAARILFPPSAPYYLHTEDLAALGVVLAKRLISSDPDRGRGIPG